MRRRREPTGGIARYMRPWYNSIRQSINNRSGVHHLPHHVGRKALKTLKTAPHSEGVDEGSTPSWATNRKPFEIPTFQRVFYYAILPAERAKKWAIRGYKGV